MDIISVTDDALRNAYLILHNLESNSEMIVNKCISVLNNSLSSLDEKLKKDIIGLMDSIKKTEEQLKQFVLENKDAITDRINKIPDYEKSIYIKRNFGL